MQEVDSQALQDVSHTLRLSSRGGQLTHFDDENLQQVIDVGSIVRRGLAVTPGGLYQLLFEQTHNEAGTLTSQFELYDLVGGVGVSGVAEPWPRETARKLSLDVWVVQALLTIVSGAGNPVGAILDELNTMPVGGGVATTAVRHYAAWGSTVTAVLGTDWIETHEGLLAIDRPMRMGSRRGGVLRFRSEADAALSLRCRVVLALLPAGMGQDALGAG